MRRGSLVCLGLLVLMISVTSHAQVSVGISIRVGPPALPVYVQPVCPGPGYIWTPGYWAYGPDGYYWVPGTWVEPPEVGVLWTPGYWGWSDGFYVWHGGYWGPHVGFYGGINYGFGYTGVGFVGGYWRERAFYYNRAVTNVNVVNIHNTYNTTVINNTTINRVSYNGGAGGTRALPTSAEREAAQERHFQPTAAQFQHHQAAGSNRELLASVNHGSPTIAASPRPGVFRGQGVVAANRNNSFNRSAANNTIGPRSGGDNNSFRGRGPDTFRGRGPDNPANGPGAYRGNRTNMGNDSMYRANQRYAGPSMSRGNPHANESGMQARNGGQHENKSQGREQGGGKEKHNRN